MDQDRKCVEMITNWIRETERMPEHGQSVLASLKNQEVIQVTWVKGRMIELCYEDEGYDEGDVDDFGDVWMPEGWYSVTIENYYMVIPEGYVIAWMPLPKPFKL